MIGLFFTRALQKLFNSSFEKVLFFGGLLGDWDFCF